VGLHRADAGAADIEELFMTKEEELAFDLALEALEFIPESGSMIGAHAEGKRVKAITAIKQARSAPVPENFMDALRFDVAMRDAAQPTPVQEPVPDYAWPTVADYEKDVGFEVNDAFKMAWGMARTTNALFTQVEKNT